MISTSLNHHQRSRRPGLVRVVAVAAAMMLLVSSCSLFGGDDDEDSASAPGGGAAADGVVAVGGGFGASGQLRISLSEGQNFGPTAADLEVVNGTPLTDDQVAAIVERLPELESDPDDRQEFNRPPRSLRPPLVGETIETAFPPPGPGDSGPTSTPVGPLEVLRFQPEGDVAVAPFLSVTFNQPMVDLATLDQLAQSSVPVVISPDVDGRWRWIGTRTLRFELEPGPIDRLPAATEYTVTIPAGVQSATGSELAEEVTFGFSTPAPQVAGVAGVTDSMGAQPVLVAVFDQRVDPEAVLETVTLTVDGDTVQLRIATESEIEDDDTAARATAGALDGRWVAVTPSTALEPASSLSLAIGPGTPSAEGPRTSTEVSTHNGRTFDALAVTERNCNYGGPCQPGSPFVITFNNTIDGEGFDPTMVTADPAIGGMRVAVFGNQMTVTGATRARTDYTITVPGSLTDVFGQTLGDDEEVKFEVGPAPTQLVPFNQQHLTVDPMAERPGISVTTVNHDSVQVTAWRVDAGDLASFRTYEERFWSDTDPGDPAWPEVFDREVDVDGDDDTAVETFVDLSDAFDESPDGQLVVRVAPTREFDDRDDDFWMNRPSLAWVQSTTLGIDAVIDNDELVIWTTDLTTGEPRPGVDVELIGTGVSVSTDDGGVATAALSGKVRGLLGRETSADRGTALLASSWYEGWESQRGFDQARWYVFDDRGIYKPGEKVRVTGWLRQQPMSGDAQLGLYDDTVTVNWRAYDPFGNELGDGETTANRLGGFNFVFDVPNESNLGFGFVEMQATGPGVGRDGAYGSHQFQIQDFRTPEFEVIARPESPAPYYVAEPATIAVDAAYFAGGPLPNADVGWTVTSTTSTYAPPRWDQYTFGIWQPWWFGEFGGRDFGPAVEYDYGFGADVAEGFPGGCFGPDCPGGPEVERFSGRTDGDGHHFLRLDFDGPEVDLPSTVTAEAAVTDVNRQVWASRTNIVIHPARYYVGLRSDRPFVEQGTPLRIDTVVTDVDGVSAAGRTVDVSAGRLEGVWSNGQWTETLADEQTCTVTSVELDPVDTAAATAEAGTDIRPDEMRCEFETELGGQYRVTAVVTDDDGQRNRSELTVWVSGADVRPNRRVTQESVTMIPNAETYAPGDTAQLLVQAPFAPASGLVTVIRGGIVSTQTFETDDGSSVIELDIEEKWIPNVTVQVDMVGTATRLADDGTPQPDAPLRPAFASGQLNLSIPPVTRELQVTAEPANPALKPGDDTVVEVSVKGPDGRSVSGADVAVVVVDEAVLSLTGYELADPLDVFYRDVFSEVFTEYTRSGIVLHRADVAGGDLDGESAGAGEIAEEETAEDSAAADFDETTTTARNLNAPEASLVQGDDGGDAAAGAGTPIVVRTDFDALAVYAPSESTGPDGTVTVDVPLPDNLTRYRVMAVAVDGANHFGKGESTITARLPLMVRPSAPRFLNFGDRFELPVVVQNQMDSAIEVDVAVEGSNLTMTEGSGRRVTVPANDRIEVRFPAAADEAGTARFRVVGVTPTDSAADAATIELPVYTPATSEAFATYGVVDDSNRDGGDGLSAVAQPFTTPEGVFPQFGGLEITTSSTAVQALTDAVLYLHDYRYDSADGYASRIMAVAALRDVLDAFAADGLPSPAVLNARVQSDIERLSTLQNDDGGFHYWQRGRPSVPWTSIQATHALILAKKAGYRVDAEVLARATERLANIESLYESTYTDEIRAALSAYAVNVRNLGGDPDPAKALDVYRERSEVLHPDGLAWLWPVITSSSARAEIEQTLLNRATDTAGSATFATNYDEGQTWLISGSDRRTDGIVLGALISEAPQSDLIPKVVNGLLSSQTRGRWNNVIENGFILVAMHDYFETFEDVTPDFVARAWLGDDYVAEYTFEGRTTDRANTLVPMAEVIGATGTGNSEVVVAKDGPGRLYYRLGLRYAPDDLVLDPRDEGFVVDRIYEGAEPGDVTRGADGTWRIRSGATVKVTLTMVADAARNHVALIDPLPAGLEPINPALAVSATSPEFPSASIGDSAEGGDDGFGPQPLAALDWCWCWNWYQHQNLRDDRAEAFTSWLPGGVYTYSYTARATTPGEFVVPPARAEEMYAPETFGRSSSAKVVIDD